MVVTQPGTSNRPAPDSGSPSSSSSSDSGDSHNLDSRGPAELADENPPYTHEEALRIRKERDEAREELGEVSKQFGIAQAEWEDQRKQLCDAITGLMSFV